MLLRVVALCTAVRGDLTLLTARHTVLPHMLPHAVGTMSINIQGYPTLFTTGSGHYMNPTNAKETLCDLYRTWMYLKHNADLPAVFLTPGNARLMAGFMDLGFQEQNDLWRLFLCQRS